MYEIILYTASWCGNCPRQKQIYDAAGVEYTERPCDDVDNLGEAKGMGIRTLPATVVYKDGHAIEILSGVTPAKHMVMYSNTHVEAVAHEVSLNG